MKSLLLSLIGLVCFGSQAAMAYPQVSFQYVPNTGGLAIRGRDLCDSAKFRIRVSDATTGESGFYQSESGRTEWVISKSCSIYFPLARAVLTPGHVLQVRTYAYDGHRTHTFQKAIPCEETAFVTVFNGDYVSEGEVVSLASCGGVYPVPGPVQPAPVPPQPVQPSCSTHVAVSQNHGMGVVGVSCNVQIGAVVQISDASTGAILCHQDRFFANEVEAVACSFGRNPNHRLDYRVTVNDSSTGALLANDSGTLRKDATFNYPPQGRLVSQSYMKPQAQKRALFAKGSKWKFTVQVQVADRDVDSSEGIQPIQVDLISKDTGARIATSMANSNETVSFDLLHTYGHVFGSDEDSKEGLRRGQNNLMVRVHDAYTENGGSYVDVGPITVDLSN